MIRVAIGCDHIVTEMKNQLVGWLYDHGYTVTDCGTFDKKRTHYPVYGREVGRKVASGQADFGIVLCGTGIGISNAANKVPGIRCVLAAEAIQAENARRFADANVLAMGGRAIGMGKMEEIVQTFLCTPWNQKNKDALDRLNQMAQVPGVLEDDHFFDDLLCSWEQGKYHD